MDRNDYSTGPRFVGWCIEARLSHCHITGVVLDSGELSCGHGRAFAVE